jgi:hypothetical protein
MSELSPTIPTVTANVEDKMNETNKTLKDLIERGLAIREERIAEERARLTAIQDAHARARAENTRLILELLPSSVAEHAQVEVHSEIAYVRVKQIFPGEGSLTICVRRSPVNWMPHSYEATNPQGYYLKFQTLEEAVAYAAGVLEV